MRPRPRFETPHAAAYAGRMTLTGAPRASNGLAVDAVLGMLAARGDQLTALMAEAAALRDEGLAAAGRPGVVTYSRKVFIPVTTLCRDRCHYCTFVDTPAQLLKLGKPTYMPPEQILRVAHEGAALGCKEALFTLGDRPEARWPEARAWLDEHGYTSTLDYLEQMARLVTAETGLLVHLNPGVMTRAELARLRPVAPSMGMMLETTAERLWSEPGQVHYGSPDKEPAVRLRVLEDAGELRIPFTTGLLIGIGESLADRAASLLALRELAERHGHLQEVIMQNFRAKPGTAMRDAPDADAEEYLAAVATARLVLGPSVRIQAPPNLSDPDGCAALLAAGIDDWGGVSPLTPDHVNPERPWPEIDALMALTAAAGFTLRERLTAHPEYVLGHNWIDPTLRPAVTALAGADGLAAAGAPGGMRRTRMRDSDGSDDRGDAFLHPSAVPTRTDAELENALLASGDELDDLVAEADAARRHETGDVVTMVVNRNVTSTGWRGLGSVDDPGTFGPAELEQIVIDAVELGATEICIQGRLPNSEDPSGYLEIARIVKATAPGVHLHAFRPADVDDLAERGGLGLDRAIGALLEAGVDTMPGTGLKMLSESIRQTVAPGDLPIDRWEEVVRALHAAGVRTSSGMFYGHIETRSDRIAHLRRLQAIQEAHGGFTELVPAPLPGWGIPLQRGRSTIDEHRAMFAVARLMLGASIRHIQVPWPRVGPEAAAVLLRSGADDLGGTLLDGRILPATGVESGIQLDLADGAAIAKRLLRPFRQRTTTYGAVD